LQYLEGKPHLPWLVFAEIYSVDFCRGGKTEKPREKPTEQCENQQQTQPTYTDDTGPESKPGYVGDRSHHCDIPGFIQEFKTTQPMILSAQFQAGRNNTVDKT